MFSLRVKVFGQSYGDTYIVAAFDRPLMDYISQTTFRITDSIIGYIQQPPDGATNFLSETYFVRGGHYQTPTLAS